MWPKIWSLLLLGSVIYPFLSAKFCSKSYINGKWITEGDCGGPEMMSQIMKELQLKVEDERKRAEEQSRAAYKKKKKRISDKKWTVFQRRKYGNVDFFRGWDDYVKGFGNRDGDFWLGLETMHQMTKEGNMEMKIEMISKKDGINWVAKYSHFRVGPGSDNYRLRFSTGFSGNATRDTFRYTVLQQFTTKDADHDRASYNCAHVHGAGWWYRSCGENNLNGNFNETNETGQEGFRWDRGSLLRFSEMKFRKRF